MDIFFTISDIFFAIADAILILYHTWHAIKAKQNKDIHAQVSHSLWAIIFTIFFSMAARG